MDEINIKQLINLVSKNPVLWQWYDEDYNEPAKQFEAWNRVLAELNPDYSKMPVNNKIAYGKLISEKWETIKDKWMEYNVKETVPDEVKKEIYQDELDFLHKPLRVLQKLSFLKDCIDIDGDSNNEDDESKISDENIVPKKRARSTDETEKESQFFKEDSSDTNCTQEHEMCRNKLYEQIFLKILKGDDDPKLSFFKSVLPLMKDFTNYEVLELQMGVMNIIQDIILKKGC